jgi:hypothetical protein
MTDIKQCSKPNKQWTNEEKKAMSKLIDAVLWAVGVICLAAFFWLCLIM